MCEVYRHAGRGTCERAGDHLGVSADLRLRQNLLAICQLSCTQQARRSTSFQRVANPCLSSPYWSTWSTGMLCFSQFYRGSGNLNTAPPACTASNLPIMPLFQPLWFFLHSINQWMAVTSLSSLSLWTFVSWFLWFRHSFLVIITRAFPCFSLGVGETLQSLYDA